MENKKLIRRIISIVLFISALFLTELSPFSGRAVAFLNFMIQIVNGFSGVMINKIKIVSYIFAIVRGLLDTVENCILINQIYSFPNFSQKIIGICNIFTRVKFHFMRVWLLTFVVMIFMQIRENRKNRA